jgi:hypothetical protein
VEKVYEFTVNDVGDILTEHIKAKKMFPDCDSIVIRFPTASVETEVLAVVRGKRSSNAH